MSIVLSLLAVIVVSYGFTRLANRMHFSSVIGLIAAGLVLAAPPFKDIIVGGHRELFEALANAGLITLMFLAGFEVSWNMLIKERKDAFTVTIFTVITSLLLGLAVFTVLGYSLGASLIMGICFGITAEATKARVLMQLKKIKTRLGSLLMGTGIINDILGVFMLLVITYTFTHDFSMKEVELLGGIMMAFFIGTFVHYLFDRETEKLRRLENTLLVAIVPFFFVNIGLNFDLSALHMDIPILLLVVATATAGQILGVFLTRPITKLSWKQLWLVGWGMNSKGAVELAIAYVAMTVGILPVNLYSALVVTALVSTVMFQLIIFRMVKNNRRIMN